MKPVSAEDKETIVNLASELWERATDMAYSDHWAYSYDVRGLINKMQEVIKLLEHIETTQPENRQ